MSTCRLWNPEGQSRADIFATKPAEEKAARLASLSHAERVRLARDWRFWGRCKQQTPPLVDVALPNAEPWRYWMILAGRMWGKSRTAAEWVRGEIESGRKRAGVLFAPRYQDIEKVQVANLMGVFPPDRRPRYVRSQLRMYFWPYNDSAPYCDIRTGENPDGFRGPEWDFAWGDEFAAIDKLDDVWQLLVPAMRAVPPKGGPPQMILTTTPRNKPVLHNLIETPTCVLTQGPSAENQHNVAQGVLDAVRFIYGGSDLAEQELCGVLLGNEPGALFRQEWFNASRSTKPETFKRLIIIIDTSGSGKDTACECGILLLGLGHDGFVYVLRDYSLRASPEEWAKVAMKAYEESGAQEIVYEANYGGELVPTVFKLLSFKPRLRQFYAKGTKAERAQPASAMAQTGKVRMVGVHKELEKQCCTWTPKDRKSPDRMDALADGVSELVPAVAAVRPTAIRIPGLI